MNQSKILDELFEVILKRKTEMPKGSYTAKLFQNGQEMIVKKLKEEAGEVVKAARQETNQRLIEESSDLIYHLLVLFACKDIELDSIYKELNNRRK